MEKYKITGKDVCEKHLENIYAKKLDIAIHIC